MTLLALMIVCVVFYIPLYFVLTGHEKEIIVLKCNFEFLQQNAVDDTNSGEPMLI